MKNFLKIFFSIILIVIILGVIFYMVDTTRVYNEYDPIFTFSQKLLDGTDYSAKVDMGLGYKIIRFDMENQEKIVRVGTIFMKETPPYIDKKPQTSIISGDSGEIVVKVTTFGEKYKDSISIEGMDEDVYIQDINSKLGYTMTYYYELFDYTGFEDYDRYLWNRFSGENSGDYKSLMTVYDISNEDAYKESIEKISKKDIFEELSGEQSAQVQNLYYRSFKENEIEKVNYIYIMNLNNDLKLMVDLFYPQEAEEGIGIYMHKMAKSIKN